MVPRFVDIDAEQALLTRRVIVVESERISPGTDYEP